MLKTQLKLKIKFKKSEKISILIQEIKSTQNNNKKPKNPTKDTFQLLEEKWIATIQTQIKEVQRLFTLLYIKAHSTSWYSMKNLIGNIYILVFFHRFKECEFIVPPFYPLKFTVVQLKQALRTVISIICNLLPSS